MIGMYFESILPSSYDLKEMCAAKNILKYFSKLSLSLQLGMSSYLWMIDRGSI